MALMEVEIFDPQRFFGFCKSNSQRIFFHLSVFRTKDDIPPIPGEFVEVILLNAVKSNPTDLEKASSVTRITAPTELHGRLKSFNFKNGWGFLEDHKNRTFYIHATDIVSSEKFTKIGKPLTFYEGKGKDGRPRAFHCSFNEDLI